MEHFKTVCEKCNTIINQCRCFSMDKKTNYIICENCEPLKENKVTTKPSKISLINRDAEDFAETLKLDVLKSKGFVCVTIDESEHIKVYRAPVISLLNVLGALDLAKDYVICESVSGEEE